MEVASREFTAGSGLTFRVAAVATKKTAASKKQRGKMGKIGLQRPRREAGKECQEEAWHWEDGASGQEFGIGRENRE